MLRQMVVSGLTIDPFTNSPIMILKDVDSDKAVPIWIGLLEATAIASELENIKFSRPMTRRKLPQSRARGMHQFRGLSQSLHRKKGTVPFRG